MNIYIYIYSEICRFSSIERSTQHGASLRTARATLAAHTMLLRSFGVCAERSIELSRRDSWTSLVNNDLFLDVKSYLRTTNSLGNNYISIQSIQQIHNI